MLMFLFIYIVIEVFFDVLYTHGTIYPTTNAWIFENTGRTVHFDPIRGFRLTSTSSRYARMTKGIIEYVGTFRGNSQGFPDRDDFSPDRTEPNALRLAVFGDSFTAAQYLDMNWPDALEDLVNKKDGTAKIELLNFAVDGGGLANWWSILTHIIHKEQYQIDALLFAVYPGNLFRGFSVSEHRGYSRPMFGRVKSWDPEHWPKNAQEARILLRPLQGYIVSEEQFSEALISRTYPLLPRPWKPYLLLNIYELLKSFGRMAKDRLLKKSSYPSDSRSGDIFSQQQKELIMQIANFSQDKLLPVFVVHVPSRIGLIQKKAPDKDVVRFSELLNATFIDGNEAFSGLTEIEIRSHFFPFDAHWDQSGSDRFSSFIYQKLKEQYDDLFSFRGGNWDAFRNHSPDLIPGN